jgi:dTDP-4-amino-4,6-dideoxygalactose transaminase
MLLVRDKKIAEKIRVLSMNGLSADSWKRYGTSPIKSYQVIEAGLKGNMSDIHAAIGRTQLKRWPFMKMRRDAIWKIYEEAFGKREKGHSTHLFTIMAEDRDFIRKFLYEKGIGTGVHFNPLHLEPAYRFMGHMSGDFPFAELIGAHTVSLPISSTMTEEDARRVVSEVSNSKVHILKEERCPKRGEK